MLVVKKFCGWLLQLKKGQLLWVGGGEGLVGHTSLVRGPLRLDSSKGGDTIRILVWDPAEGHTECDET